MISSFESILPSISDSFNVCMKEYSERHTKNTFHYEYQVSHSLFPNPPSFLFECFHHRRVSISSIYDTGNFSYSFKSIKFDFHDKNAEKKQLGIYTLYTLYLTKKKKSIVTKKWANAYFRIG